MSKWVASDALPIFGHISILAGPLANRWKNTHITILGQQGVGLSPFCWRTSDYTSLTPLNIFAFIVCILIHLIMPHCNR